MDSFSNPLLSSSEKIYCGTGLDAPVLRPKLEDALALSSLLVNNGGKNPDLIGGSGCELTSLPLPPLAGPELFSSNPTIWDPSSFKVRVSVLIPRLTYQSSTKPKMKINNNDQV